MSTSISQEPTEQSPYCCCTTRNLIDAVKDSRSDTYLRLHDPVQKNFITILEQNSESSGWKFFGDYFVHFLRDVSLYQLERTGVGFDEVCAFAFESAYDYALASPQWLSSAVDAIRPEQQDIELVEQLNLHFSWLRFGHQAIYKGVVDIHAQLRETDPKADEPDGALLLIYYWFRAAIALAANELWNESRTVLRETLNDASRNGWRDARIFSKALRRAPLVARTRPRVEWHSHLLLKLTAARYSAQPIVEEQFVKLFAHLFLLHGVEFEEQIFCTDLELAGWVRDTLQYAARQHRETPDVIANSIQHRPPWLDEIHNPCFVQPYTDLFGENALNCEVIETTQQLIALHRKVRGTRASQNAAESSEAIFRVVEAALWAGWLDKSLRKSPTVSKNAPRKPKAGTRRKTASTDANANPSNGPHLPESQA